MVFANPAYLWALLGILVPVAIHLWSRRQAETLRIGSTQFLEESESIRARAIRPSEWLLLVLRMAVISLLALLLASPVWPSSAANKQVAYVVEPGLAGQGTLLAVLDSLGGDADIRMLQPGLPEWDGEAVAPESGLPVYYWQLARELDNLPADSIVIFTRAYVSGFRSKLPALETPSYWVVMADDGQTDQALQVVGKPGAREVLMLRSAADYTSFSRQPVEVSTARDSVSAGGDSLWVRVGETDRLLPIEEEEPLRVVIAAADSLEGDRKFIRASLNALGEFTGRELLVSDLAAETESRDMPTDLLIWLRPGPPPEAAARILYLDPDPFAAELIVPAGGNLYRLTEHLNSENSVSRRLTEHLLEVLMPTDTWAERAAPFDRRQLEAGFISPVKSGSSTAGRTMASRDASDAIWVFLVLLLILERLLALKRKQ